MSEPRKINRSGASAGRSIRRPQDTQGRQTGQFEIPDLKGKTAPQPPASGAQAAPSTGVRRPAQAPVQAAYPSTGTRSAAQAAGQPSRSAAPRPVSQTAGQASRPATGTRPMSQTAGQASRPATGTRPVSQTAGQTSRPATGTRPAAQTAGYTSRPAAGTRSAAQTGGQASGIHFASQGTGRTSGSSRSQGQNSRSGAAHSASHGGGRGGSGRKGRKGGAVAAKRGNVFFGVLTTLIIIMAIFYLAFRIIMGSIAPESGTVSISDMISTPEEYQGDQLNVLVVGVDWDEDRAYGTNDSNTNDGNTDMIMYVHFDLKENQLYMLQIPRNTLVAGVYNSGNYQINNVAMYNDGYASLADCIYKMYGLPVDRYVAIDMASFREIVDAFNGVEVYVPHDMEDGKGSKLYAGYQTLHGEQAEFFVRCRYGKGFERSDLDRLNMQRYFYSALFRRLRSISVWEAVKMVPIAMEYVTTDLSASDIASLAVSFLKVDSSNIMICQLPSCNAEPYNGNSVLITARQESADLLNQYFRDYTGPMDASQLQLPDWTATSGASDPNIQFMNSLDAEAEQGQQDVNIDGSYNVITDTPEETAAPEATQEPAA